MAYDRQAWAMEHADAFGSYDRATLAWWTAVDLAAADCPPRRDYSYIEDERAALGRALEQVLSGEVAVVDQDLTHLHGYRRHRPASVARYKTGAMVS